MNSEDAPPALPNNKAPALPNNEDSGIGINDGGNTPTSTTVTTSGHNATIKRTTLKTEGIKVPTTTTKIKVDTSKMTTLCERLEGSLMQLVDDTREDDLFISRLQEELLQAEEKWEDQVTKIADNVVHSKNQLTEEAEKKELSELKDELAALQQRQDASRKEKDDLSFKLRMKRVKIDQLNDEMKKMKEQMKGEQEWREKVQRQLEAIQKGKDDTDKDRQATMVKVSSELFKYRNKHVPDVGELKDLHELVDRVHHSIGYLMVLGEQAPVAQNEALKEAADKAEQMARRKSSVTSAL